MNNNSQLVGYLVLFLVIICFTGALFVTILAYVASFILIVRMLMRSARKDAGQTLVKGEAEVYKVIIYVVALVFGIIGTAHGIVLIIQQSGSAACYFKTALSVIAVALSILLLAYRNKTVVIAETPLKTFKGKGG
jgi:hypothetical protein